MRIALFTDIPVWVRPLAGALERQGAEVVVVGEADEAGSPDVVVNRFSTRLVRRFPDRAEAVADALDGWEEAGIRVVNGAKCLRLGWSKIEQARLFESCGAETPRTAVADPKRRAFPAVPVLLKPPAGGFGKGIRRLEAGEPIPADVVGDPSAGWIEQERIRPADGAVHRIEVLGDRILYEAVSAMTGGDFNHCLANADGQTPLFPEEGIAEKVRDRVERIRSAAAMELGAVEYLMTPEGRPLFIDLNPVSSLHPQAGKALGHDPLDRIAGYIAKACPSEGP